MSLALLFPGQGSQFAGMGKELCERSPAARAVFEEADVVLEFPLSRLCFEGPEEELKSTAAERILVTAFDPALPMGERFLPAGIGEVVQAQASDPRLVWVFGTARAGTA
jgi:[acyl-carrier-protein] S-malonyltransferase